jgi:hypothetical protein
MANFHRQKSSTRNGFFFSASHIFMMRQGAFFHFHFLRPILIRSYYFQISLATVDDRIVNVTLL